MSLNSLVQQNYEKYVAENQDREKCWFFVHIPKTAGSSFRLDLVGIRSPAYNIHVDDDNRDVPYKQKIVDAVRAFNAKLPTTSFQFASGHVPVETLAAEVERSGDLQLITMLRDPIKRVISDFRYQRTPSHPNHREFIEQFPTFESYFEAPWAQNRMFQFLRPGATASLDECIKHVIDRFAFVGIVEMYPMSFRLVTRLMEAEQPHSSHERKTSESDVGHIEPTPELTRRLRALNSLDVALYEYFHALLLPMRHFIFGNIAKAS